MAAALMKQGTGVDGSGRLTGKVPSEGEVTGGGKKYMEINCFKTKLIGLKTIIKYNNKK